MGTTATCCTGGCEGSGTAFMFDMEANQPPRKHHYLHPHQGGVNTNGSAGGYRGVVSMQSMDLTAANIAATQSIDNNSYAPGANANDPLRVSHETMSQLGGGVR